MSTYSYILNQQNSDKFSLYSSNINELINLFVPVSFFHMQFSKYFLTMDQTSELVSSFF